MRFSSAEEKHRWMITAPIPPLVGRLAVPTMISMLTTTIYNMADTYFVGGLGTSAQGAVGVILPLMALIQAIGFTFGNGSGNCISRLLGQKDHRRAEQVAATGFFTAVLTGLFVAVLGLLFLEPLVRLLGATDTILPYARAYARFILLAAPFMIGSFVLNNLLRFEGNATYAMIGITVGGVLNIALDPLFIFVLDLGTAGAALATALSQVVSFSILLYNNRHAGSIPIRWRAFTPRWTVLREILRGGLPSLYRQGLGSVASVLLNWAAKPYGDAAIAAMTITTRFTMFAGSALIGFGQGFQPVCGFNYGARHYERVREAFWFCVRTGTAALVVIAGIGFALSPRIVLLFQKNDPRVLELGTRALRCYMLVLPTMAYSVMNNMMLQTVGEALRASVLAMARQGLFFVPLILTLPAVLGLDGVILAQPAADLCALLLTIPLSNSFLRKMRRMEEKCGR